MNLPIKIFFRPAAIRTYLLPLAVILTVILPAEVFSRPPENNQKIFEFNIRSARDLKNFRTYAEMAARFKKYGQVQINVGTVADKAWFMIPEGGSPWHEYACYMSAPWMFFPHPKIAPHLPAAWVEANRKLLLAKASIARELGLDMLFAGKNTEMLPESFFRQYPHLRGPRVDHPRRSRGEAFSWCVDLEETRDIIRWTMSELLRSVPEIKTFSSGTNDAGSGICWAAAQYPGPNGPRHCQNRNVGDRVRDLVLAVQEGARQGGGDIVFRWSNVNFWQNEMDVILPKLPEKAFINSRDRSRLGVGTLINEAYPFLGLIDPLAVIESMERYDSPRIETLSIGFSAMYDRCEDTPEAVGMLFDLVEDCMSNPSQGLSERLERLKEVAGRWAGEANRERVFEALYDLHEALELKEAVAGRYSNFYCGVSMRHLTRPLVIKPELLEPAEEAYFLPYVFNVRENEARMDWIDLHGGRMTGTATYGDGGLRQALGLARSAASRLENFEGAPQREFLNHLALSLKMWASEVRSIHNFYHAQLIRDKYAEILAGAPHVPAKVAIWEGE
ncbi:MAG TPA: hypothetical protein VJ417_04455, partial [Candidatus Glassbacteria bacterium]|nr:hypothetical protein [Candidatus Glassbacteria bacterium]